MVRPSRIRYDGSEPDHAFVAEVSELSGCAADGPTYGAALAQAEVVIQQWIETARELGREIPTPRGRLLYASLGEITTRNRTCAARDERFADGARCRALFFGRLQV